MFYVDGKELFGESLSTMTEKYYFIEVLLLKVKNKDTQIMISLACSKILSGGISDRPKKCWTFLKGINKIFQSLYKAKKKTSK